MVEPELTAGMESRYRSVLEQMTDAFYVMNAVRDEHGKITDFLLLDCNGNYARRLNLERSEVIGRLYSAVYTRARESGMMARLAHVVTSGEVFAGEFVFDAPGLVKRHVRVRMTPVADGVEVTSTDISDTKRLEDEHDGFFRLVPDMLCVAGLDGFFKRLNPAWVSALGWSIEELMAKPFIEFVHPDDRAKTRTRNVGLTGGRASPEFENRYRHKNGTYRILAWRTALSNSRDLIFASARDVTELRTTEAALQESKERLAQSERLASLGTLAAGMGHEINNPLLAVISNLGFADEASQAALRAFADDGGEPPSIGDGVEHLRVLREALNDAIQGAERVRRIVQELRRFARAETVASNVLKIPDILDAALKIAAPELGNLRVVKQLGSTPMVMADETKLAQVFANLLVNAGQALGDHSRNEIRIRTSHDTVGRAVIEIIDAGIGIAPDVLPRIFDPFFTTKRIGEGMGLGLAVCHSNVAMFGGEITVQSTPGKGSTFRITLPAARLPVRTQTIRLPIIQTEARAKILVIDDEEVVGRSLQRILSRAHDVDIAMDGPTALAMIAKTRYEMILCDVMMPNMSGVDIFEKVSSSSPEQASRIVFMTGGAFTVRTQQFLATTTNTLVLKPFSADSIRSIAATVIAGGTVST